MEQDLKERLAGAAILVAVAVIFIPIIFSNPAKVEVLEDLSFPETPKTEFNSKIIRVVENDDNAPIIENMATVEKLIPTNKNNSSQKLTEQKKTITESKDKTTSALSAWSIQLGSFANEGNAQSMNKKLQQVGYKSFVKSLKKDGRISYQVKVGVQLKRSEADALLKNLKEKMQLDGIVVSYP